MGKSLLIAVDLGTTNIKTAVYDLEGTYLTGASEKVDEIRGDDGSFIQKGDMIFDKVCRCLQKTAISLGNDTAEIAAIGFSGQMAGSIGVGENWADVTSWSCSVDTRYLPYADRIREQFAADMYRWSGTGSPVMCSKYKWFESDFPEEHEKIVKYTMLNGYIIGRLSEIPVEEAPIDYSLISWTGLADIKNLSWSEELCAEMGIGIDKLSKIVSGDTVIGCLSENSSRLSGLPAGIPLVLGAGDKICGSVGAESISEGNTMIELASYAAINQRVNSYHPDLDGRRFDIIGGISSEGYNAHKYLQGSGITTEWFMNEFLKGTAPEGKDPFVNIEELAAGLPAGSDRMIAIGEMGGSAIPLDQNIKGAFVGQAWRHKKEHFYKALIESFTYDLASTLQAMERCYPEYLNGPVTVLGGGAKSLIWPQILSDVTGREIRTLNRSDIALLGAAKIAAVGAGIFDSYDHHYGNVEVSRVYTPDQKNHQVYQKYMEIYKDLEAAVSEYCRRLANI